MMSIGHRTLWNICDIYKVDNIINKSTITGNVYIGEKGNNHS